MILRSEMKEEVRERRSNHAEKGGAPDGATGKLETLRGRRREVTSRDYEERVTYRTITRTEFQKRRASFESHDEATADGRKQIGRDERAIGLHKKTRSMDELTRTEADPFHVQFQEKEMTEKLEDIHRMISDMQEMTKQLKDRNYRTEKVHVKPLGMISPRESSSTGEAERLIVESVPALTVKPVRYRSTILIAIGSKWKRFKEEIELKVDSRFFADLDGFRKPTEIID